jgi:N-acetyl-gamma-glutamyl-phosphate reductase
VKRIRAVVIGAPGYSGGELVSILLRHPHAEIVGMFASSRRTEGDRPATIADFHPRLRGRIDLPVRPIENGAVAALGPDAVFLATPHEASLDLAHELLSLAPAPRVFDLSGAFRLRASDYPRHYGFPHHREELLARAVYGLPELNRAAIAKADLVAVPGCYPTSAILPLAPLARAGAIAKGRVTIVDSTSGVSGAGRTPTAKTHLCEISLQPYNVLKHRHAPEIELHSGAQVVFTPHLGAFERGILSTIHVDLAEGWTGAKARAALEGAYRGERFVRLLPADTWPSIAGVRQTNYCDIGLASDDGRRHLILVSAIDNLGKGAAGQAVQCMNVRFDLPETSGLDGDLA